MREHVKAGEPFVREDVTPEAALERFKAEGQDYKVELIEDLVSNNGVDTVSLYTNGPFTDLCRGPHAPSTDRIKAFKLLCVAGAYWRGNSDNTMLTRIYGTAFHSKDDLAAHLERLEQARAARPPQARPRARAVQLLRAQPRQRVLAAAPAPRSTTRSSRARARCRPSAATRRSRPRCSTTRKLWEISGHWDKYRENMFVTESEDQPMGLKPMNCPGHCAFYAMGKHSYRELPIRYAEPGLLHRNEPSGTLHGLLRVRHFIQDDAHIFCTEEQVEQEVLDCLDVRLRLVRPVRLRHADRALDPARAADRHRRDVGPLRGRAGRRRSTRGGYEYDINEGDGAFYGPKIDLHMRDSLEPLVAARDRPARLQLPRALRPHLHGRRQRRAPPGDAPPGAGRLVRALHRDPARAHRRRAAAVARALPGRGAPAGRPPQRLRARGRRGAARGGAARRRRRPHGVGRAQDPRGRAAQGARTCSWSATARQRSAPWRCAATARATWGRVALDEAVQRLVGEAA